MFLTQALCNLLSIIYLSSFVPEDGLLARSPQTPFRKTRIFLTQALCNVDDAEARVCTVVWVATAKATLDLGSSAVDMGASLVFSFLAMGTSEAGTRCGNPFPFLLLVTGASAARARSGGPFPFLFLSLEEDGWFFLAGAVAGASAGFSGPDIEEWRAASSTIEAGGATITESGDPRSKFYDTEGDCGGGDPSNRFTIRHMVLAGLSRFLRALWVAHMC